MKIRKKMSQLNKNITILYVIRLRDDSMKYGGVRLKFCATEQQQLPEPLQTFFFGINKL